MPENSENSKNCRETFSRGSEVFFAGIFQQSQLKPKENTSVIYFTAQVISHVNSTGLTQIGSYKINLNWIAYEKVINGFCGELKFVNGRLVFLTINKMAAKWHFFGFQLSRGFF